MDGVLVGDGVGGIAAAAHSVVFGVGVLVGGGVGKISSAVRESEVGVLVGDGVGGIAAAAHRSEVDAELLDRGVVGVIFGALGCWASASTASSKNLLSPAVSELSLLSSLKSTRS